MRLYHFLDAEYALEDISKRRIKIARLDDLNDPFELFCAALPTPDHRKVWHKFVKDLSNKIGVVCFSKNWENPLLWSHYADKHKGLCLGFDVPEGYLETIQYKRARLKLNIRLQLPDGGLGEAEMRQILYTKFSDWEYEKEMRIEAHLEEPDESGLYFREFGNDLMLRKIIVGVRCAKTKREIQRALGSIASEVHIIKARLAFKSFKITENKQGWVQRVKQPKSKKNV